MLRLKHPTDSKSKHSHTTLIVTQDSEGRFWLSALCAKSGCKGHLLVEVLPEQVKEWQVSGVGVGLGEGEFNEQVTNSGESRAA